MLVTACDPTPHNQRLASAITLAVSTAALACDTGQTISISRAGWPGGTHEGNWLLGPKPSVLHLIMYNGGVAGANLGAWYLIPEEYDWIAPLALGALETLLVAHNMILAPRPFCGIR